MFRFKFNPPASLAVTIPDFEANDPAVVNESTLGGLVARHATPVLSRQKKYAGWKVEMITLRTGFIHLGKTNKALPFTISRY